ncbi:MAG TPA: 30S ribosome-binding factor RbfA [Vicinamibacterales bacterium]
MNRTVRLGEQIREELGDLLAREVRDPGIGFVTLTRVRVTEDLLQARVYYTALGDPDARRRTARALDRALPFLRRALGERLRLRRVPELSFTYDESVGHQARVEELLEEIRREDARRAAETRGDEDAVADNQSDE